MSVLDTRFIYLDQNQWSNLSKTLLDPQFQNGRYRDVLALAQEKTRDFSWIFPISLSHFIETKRWKTDEERKATTDIQSQFSKGFYLVNLMEVFKDELERIVTQKPRIENYITSAPLGFLGYGSDIQIRDENGKRDSNLERQASEFIENTIYSLAMEDDSVISENRNDKAVIKEDIEREKQYYLQLPKNSRDVTYKIELFNKFFGTIYGVTCSRENEKQLLSIIDAMRAFTAYFYLKKHLIQNRDGKIDENDSEDIMFLAVAIPNCDVVVAERKWINVATSLGLGEKYNTVLSKDLNCLLDYT